jgi:hypothetical protein
MTRVPIAYPTIVCDMIKSVTENKFSAYRKGQGTAKRSGKLDVEVTYKVDETTLSELQLPSRKHCQNVETELVLTSTISCNNADQLRLDPKSLRRSRPTRGRYGGHNLIKTQMLHPTACKCDRITEKLTELTGEKAPANAEAQ